MARHRRSRGMHGFGSPDYNMGAVVGLAVGALAMHLWMKRDENKDDLKGLGYSGDYGPAFMGLGYYGGGRRPSPRNPQPRPLYGLGRAKDEFRMPASACISDPNRNGCGWYRATLKRY